MKVFYHNDNDGKCAAAIVRKFERCDGIEFIKCQYGDEFPLNTIADNERVYIVDYSIEPEEMTELLAITEDVIWIDHHKTAIEKYDQFIDFAGNIKGIRQSGVAACQLTWRYFDTWGEIPQIVKLIADRDVWRFEYGDTTRDLYYGLKGIDKSPDNLSFWRDRLRVENTLSDTLRNGRVIRAAFEGEAASIVETNGFWVDFEGYKCYASNYFRGSEPFEVIEPDADVWLAFSYEGKNGCWTVSLYSNKPDIDVSEIAKEYEWNGKRGGGHKGAAGFQCNYPPFLVTEKES